MSSNLSVIEKSKLIAFHKFSIPKVVACFIISNCTSSSYKLLPNSRAMLHILYNSIPSFFHTLASKFAIALNSFKSGYNAYSL